MSDPRFERDDPPMPAWRGRSTAALSLGLHIGGVITFLLLAAIPPAVTVPAAAPMHEIARIEVPASDPPLFTDLAVPPEQLSGYEMSGLPFNFQKIISRRAVLFPFLTADLRFIERMASDVRAESAHLKNPLDLALMAPPLSLPPSVRQQIIEESFSRRDRWRHFQRITALLMGHDAHTGDAAALMRAYLDQNLLQPYCDGKTKDAQFWALVENAADQVTFLEFIRSYARTRSSSRTTTELFFLLDELAQGNREVAETVLATNVSRDLLRTAVESPPAALLASGIASDLRGWLSAHGYSARESAGTAYDEFRLRVLSTIVETSPAGYRESDARFLAGEIFFRQGNFDEAIEWWQRMKPQDGDTYADAANAIRITLARPGTVNVDALRHILSAEAARWNEVNYQRLVHFGYRCDSF